MRSRTQKRKKFVIATGVVAGLLMLAACSDATSTGPSASPSLRADRGSNPNQSTSSGSGSAQVQSVELVVNTAWTRTYKLPNGHVITFPANSICDLQTSGYGPDTWNQPCTPQTGTVTIWATVSTDAYGHPVVDFTPRMRFNPDAGAVNLTMKDAYVAETDRAIVYCADDGSACVDESLTDSSLVTYGLSGGNF